MNQKTKSIFLLVLTAMIWGFAFIAQRVGGSILGPFTYNGIRFVLGAFSLIPAMLLFELQNVDKEKVKRTIKPSILCGFFLCAASNLQQIGINMTNYAGKAGFLTGFYIIIVPILGLFLKKKVSWNVWLGAVLGVIGLFFISVNESMSINPGDLLILGSAVLFALHILCIDHYIDDVYPVRLSFGQFVTSAVISIIIALIFEDIQFSAVLDAGIPVLYGGIMSVGVGYTTQILGQKGINPTTAALILSLESVFCAIGGVLLLNETLTLRAYFGCFLVFAGILLSQVSFQKKSQNS